MSGAVTRNPFARPATESQTFSRASLLPAHSPKKRIAPVSGPTAPAPPAPNTTSAPTGTPRTPRRDAWRLLWRGGLEIGADGWRLDGVTFVAQLSFSATPNPTPNPFLGENDLCLSLESMRGRKYLQVRGLVPVTDDDIEVDPSGVQMSVTAPLLMAYFTGLLCRSSKLSPQGKTTTGIIIGLGDEGIDPTSSPVIVYGQRQGDSEQPTLRLCVGRRRAVVPIDEKKIRPGEPLPRALLFPQQRPSTESSRASSSVIRDTGVPRSTTEVVRGTPGRRGEKRPRKEEDDHQQRKAGRVVPERVLTRQVSEDIFGSRAARALSIASSTRALSLAPSIAPSAQDEEKRTLPKQTVDNKAMVRKQTLLLLEGRGCRRDHDEFKEAFSIVTKGVYFAFRRRMEQQLQKKEVQEMISAHLDMYFPSRDLGSTFSMCSEATEVSPVKPQPLAQPQSPRTPSPTPPV